jgi:hypothetical protein
VESHSSVKQPVKVLFVCDFGDYRSRAAATAYTEYLKTISKESEFEVKYCGLRDFTYHNPITIADHIFLARTVWESG